MTYIEACDWLFNQFPSYQKYGKSAFKPGLETMKSLVEDFWEELLSIPVIHIAGTNGKGSTSSMLASVLAYSGYQVGLFTSPHFLSFTERIQINGEYLPEDYVAKLIKENKDTLESKNASFFEISLWMALKYFKEKKVDCIVLETGLGGRLDATNIFPKTALGIITNIGLDHTDILGNTLPEIAAEKGGIIKPNSTALIGEYQKEIEHVFRDLSDKNKAKLLYADQFDAKNPYLVGLPGNFQEKNAQTVFVASTLLQKEFPKISHQSIEKGISQSQQMFFLPARWQKLDTLPVSVFDMGHNQNGVMEAISELKKEKYRNLHIVFSCAKNKGVEELLALLPKKAEYYLSQMENLRGEDISTLEQTAKANILSFQTYDSPYQAYKSALEKANVLDLVLVIGSSFLVSEIFEKKFGKSLAIIKKLTIFAPLQ
jgi:dihydrofolate synthase/folylpolyglutamate synthase